ncbi:MAG: hypothetical protein V3R85_00370 [Alphaproteobacteria bacterium]
MKAFLCAVVACVVISVGAGIILNMTDDANQPTGHAASVRLG